MLNVVDDDLPTSRQFLRLYKRNVRPFRSIPVPRRGELCALLPLGEVLVVVRGTVAARLQSEGVARVLEGEPLHEREAEAAAGLDPESHDGRGPAALLRELSRDESTMPLKVAIVGCGKIADAHAEQIRRIKGCDLVAVCDREALDGPAARRAIQGRSVLRRPRPAPRREQARRRAHHDAAPEPFRARPPMPGAGAVTCTWRSPSRSTRERPRSWSGWRSGGGSG